MKKVRLARIERIIAVMLSVLLLSSCGAKELGGVSSILPQEENKTQSIVSSVADKEENEQKTPSPDKEKEETNKEETNKEQNESEKPETEDTSSNKDVIIPTRPDKNPSSTAEKEDASSVKSEETSSTDERAKNDPEYRKYVMPPDNPEPVTIDREDAHLPVPISFTDSLQENGESIAFKTYEVKGTITDLDRYISIIDSYDKMVEPFDVAKDKYDEAFFKENILIAIVVVADSSPSVHEIKSVTHKDGQMCISLKRVRSGEAYAVYHGRLFIEISKQDLKDIKSIVVYEEKWGYMVDGELTYELRVLRRDPIVNV